jgi:hypothetical protein
MSGNEDLSEPSHNSSSYILSEEQIDGNKLRLTSEESDSAGSGNRSQNQNGDKSKSDILTTALDINCKRLRPVEREKEIFEVNLLPIVHDIFSWI